MVEAGLPPALEADLLSGLSACLSALPNLSRSLAHVESGLEHTHRGYVSDGIGGGKCEETRVVNMFDEKAQWMNVVTLQHEREFEEGEID